MTKFDISSCFEKHSISLSYPFPTLLTYSLTDLITKSLTHSLTPSLTDTSSIASNASLSDLLFSLFDVLPCQFNTQVSLQVWILLRLLYACMTRSISNYVTVQLYNNFYIQYLRPPFESVFKSYHFCDIKPNIKVHFGGTLS